MVRLSSLAVASTTLLAGVVSAVKCTQGTVYCGTRLLAEGEILFNKKKLLSGLSKLYADPSNQAAAEDALRAAGQTVDSSHLNDSVFLCSPQGAGLAPVIFVQYCGARKCTPGSGLNGQDACTPTSTTLPPGRM